MPDYFIMEYYHLCQRDKIRLRQYGCKVSNKDREDEEEIQWYECKYELQVPIPFSDQLHSELLSIIERNHFIGFKFLKHAPDILIVSILQMFKLAGSINRKESGVCSPFLVIKFDFTPSIPLLETFIYSPLLQKIELKARSIEVCKI